MTGMVAPSESNAVTPQSQSFWIRLQSPKSDRVFRQSHIYSVLVCKRVHVLHLVRIYTGLDEQRGEGEGKG